MIFEVKYPKNVLFIYEDEITDIVAMHLPVQQQHSRHVKETIATLQLRFHRVCAVLWQASRR